MPGPELDTNEATLFNVTSNSSIAHTLRMGFWLADHQIAIALHAVLS